MRVRDLVLELTGLELDNHMEDLGISRECLDRDVKILLTNEDMICSIEEVEYDGENDRVVIKAEN